MPRKVTLPGGAGNSIGVSNDERILATNSPSGRRVVATRAMFGNTYDQQSNGSTETSATTRMKHFITADCKDTVVIYGNFNSEFSSQVDQITVRAGWDDGSSVFPIYFNGKRDVVIDPGGIAISDPIGIPFKKGDAFWSRSYVTTGAGLKWPKNNYTYEAYPGEVIVANSDASTSSVASFGSGTVRIFAFAPLAIMGTPKSSVPCIALVGDSIMRDGSGSTVPQYGVGLRSLGADYGKNYCSINISQPGQGFVSYNTKSSIYRKLLLIGGCTHALSNMGTNDLFAGSLSTHQANAINMWRTFSRLGIKVYQLTCPPQTSSTDGWATTGNQTITNSGIQQRFLFNDWLRDGAPVNSSIVAVAVGTNTAGTLRTGSAGHPLTGYFEAADAVETARNSGIWKANYTPDGVHPNDTALNAMAATINPILFTV